MVDDVMVLQYSGAEARLAYSVKAMQHKVGAEHIVDGLLPVLLSYLQLVLRVPGAKGTFANLRAEATLVALRLLSHVFWSAVVMSKNF